MKERFLHDILRVCIRVKKINHYFFNKFINSGSPLITAELLLKFCIFISQRFALNNSIAFGFDDKASQSILS